MRLTVYGDMKWKYSTKVKMKSIFFDNESIPQYLIKSYYILVFDLLNGNGNIPKNAIIFKELQQAILKLTPREKVYLNLRYGLNGKKTCTLDYIGNKYGISKERVRQVINNAFRKLRTNKSQFVIEYKLKNLKAQKTELEKLISYYEEALNCNQESEILLEDLGLSVRAYNALKKQGITTYEMLINLSAREIKSIRNIGEKTFKEIWRKLHNI